MSRDSHSIMKITKPEHGLAQLEDCPTLNSEAAALMLPLWQTLETLVFVLTYKCFVFRHSYVLVDDKLENTGK